ncbi:MAG TPA: hypothetical protein VE974_16745 [Thermoanaerobaculia bacterium]|nr:hypothetical protein [Thermoanaerobaculia bacterium]
MTFFVFLAIVLGAFTEAASVRPVFASVAVARDSRRGHRAIRIGRTRFVRSASEPRSYLSSLPIRRFLAPLTGAAAPRAPAPCC